MMTDDDRDRGAWAVVAYREASAGRHWFVHRIASVTRWVDRADADNEAMRHSVHVRKAVIPWGDDLLLHGHLASSPDLARNPRIVAALALHHEPLFEADGPGEDASPTGRFLGCACGWMLETPLEWKGNEAQFFAHTCRSHVVFQCTSCEKYFCSACRRPTVCPAGTEEIKALGSWFCDADSCIQAEARHYHEPSDSAASARHRVLRVRTACDDRVCPWIVGERACGRPVTHRCEWGRPTCNRHKSSCCVPIDAGEDLR